MLLGHVTQGRVTVDGENFGMIADYKSLHENRISAVMSA